MRPIYGYQSQPRQFRSLVCNLQTGSITPQFHLVFDDFFETVFSEGEQEPDVWPKLVVFQSFANDFDDDDYRPKLGDEWLNPTELESRVTTRDDERNHILNSLSTNTPRGNNNNNNNNRAAAEPRNDNNGRVQPVTADPPTTLQPPPTPIAMVPEANDPPLYANVPSPRVEAPEPTNADPQRRYPQQN
jgi:hypothetical protein